MDWQGYITTDKNVLMGKPVIRGTRISVSLIVELFASGWTEKMILESYSNLTKEHLQAVFSYVKDALENDLFHPLSQDA
jgi:uncharacterized protein (DUF433 family)